MNVESKNQGSTFHFATELERKIVSRQKIYLEEEILCSKFSNQAIKLKLSCSFLIFTVSPEKENNILILPLCVDFRFKAIYSDEVPSKGFERQDERQIVSFQFKCNDNVICSIQAMEYSANRRILSAFKQRLPQQGFHEQFYGNQILGKGTFATVYLVSCKHGEELFATKRFNKKNYLNHPESPKVQTLINQLNILRQIKSKNLLHLYAVFSTNNSIYALTEYIPGKSMLKYFQKSMFKATSEQIASCMTGLIKGLRYLHRKKIAHRDIKPDNIMLRDGNIRFPIIIDFGLATKCDAEKYILTQCGTPGYIAPETLKNDKTSPIDPVCDIFSLGIIFYNLLIGKAFFEGSKPKQVAINNLKYENSVLKQKLKNLQMNKITEDLLLKMLQENPKKRITAEQALEHPYFKELNPGCLETSELHSL